jgi:hypothetical protein
MLWTVLSYRHARASLMCFQRRAELLRYFFDGTSHGAELGHIGTVLASRRQWSTHGTKIYGAESCYLGATAMASSNGSKNEIKSSKGLNVNSFQENG